MIDQFISEIKKADNYSDEEIELLLSFFEEFFIKKGDHFLEEGKISYYAGYIKSGLTMHYKMLDGIEVPRNFTSEYQ